MRGSVSPRNIMAVYPDSLTVSIPPMSWPPNVIHAAGPVAGTTNIIRPILNRDRDRSTSVVWPGTVTIIRSVITWGSGVIAFTASSPDQGRKQKNQQNQSFRSDLCVVSICFSEINSTHLHIILFGFAGVLRACILSRRNRSCHPKQSNSRNRRAIFWAIVIFQQPTRLCLLGIAIAIQHLDPAWRWRLSQTQRCSRPQQDCLGGRILQPCPMRFCGSST